MFAKDSSVLIADDDYVNSIEFPIQFVSRSQSIQSFNVAKKISFFAHVNATTAEHPLPGGDMIQIEAINTRNERYTVTCEPETKIAVRKNEYLKYIPVSALTTTSVLVDKLGYPCKILSKGPGFNYNNKLYGVSSNKAPNMCVNGLIFKSE